VSGERRHDRALVIMAKRPQPGSTKTRLQPALGADKAAQLYKCLLLDTLDLARRVQSTDPVVAVHPVEAMAYFETIAADMSLIPQHGSGLGQRLDHVMGACLDRGYQQVAAIGSDSPTLPVSFIEQAFELLDDDHVDAVLGPADDGGYYLVGVKARPGPLVTTVEMSTPTVLADTLAVAAKQQLNTKLLASWYDIDDNTDLQRLAAEPAQGPTSGRSQSNAVRTRALIAHLTGDGPAAPSPPTPGA